MIATARRGDPKGVPAALLLFGLAALAGWDVARRGSAELVAEVTLWVAVASAGVLVLQIQWCAFSDALRLALLPLPLAPGAHFLDALSTALVRSWPAAAGSAGIAAGALVAGRPDAASLGISHTATAWIVALGVGGAAAGLAGRLGRRPRGSLGRSVQAWLSGGWAAPEHAPFFYAPAVALSLTALGVVVLGPRPPWALLALPLVLVGAFAVRGALFEVVPRVHEHDRMLRRPGESEGEPATLAWRGLLPAAARPLHTLFVRQVARRTRGRGALAALGLAALAVYLLRTGASASPLSASVAVVFVAWLAGSARGAGDEELMPSWMRITLPFRGSHARAAAWLAAAPAPLVVAAAAAVAFAVSGQTIAGVCVGTAGLCLPLLGAAAPATPWLGAAAAGLLALAPVLVTTP